MSKDKISEIHYSFEAGTEPVVVLPKSMPRIGIYSSGFDPVHAGHVAFALKSQKAAGLEQIYFVPERRPAIESDPEHYVHRSVMLGNALRPYPQFSVFELPDARLTSKSLTRVTAKMGEAEYSLLTTASDLLWHEGKLPAVYYKLHLVIAVTSHAQMAEVLSVVTADPKAFGNLTFVDIGTEHVTSASVRRALRSRRLARGVLPSVWRYARKRWLYVTPHDSSS